MKRLWWTKELIWKHCRLNNEHQVTKFLQGLPLDIAKEAKVSVVYSSGFFDTDYFVDVWYRGRK